MTTFMPDAKTVNLAKGFLQLKSESETVAFLRDLLTEPEMNEFAGRFLVAQALSQDKSQRVVAKETGVSIATVTRVNQWLLRGTGGYKLVISRLENRDLEKDELKITEPKKEKVSDANSSILQFTNSLKGHHHHKAS